MAAELSWMQRAILRTLAAHDGRMGSWISLQSSPSGAGAMETFKENARELSRRGLIRGPSQALLGDELIEGGWQIGPTLAS